MQGCRGTARTRGPADLWHSTARNISPRKILARHGPQNIGTAWPKNNTMNCFYWGASSPPDLPGGAPCPPCSIFERLRLSNSPFFCWGTKILVPGSWYQDLDTEILVPRSWCQDPGTKILVPRSWYQDLGTKILVPRSWYQDLGIKILVPRSWHPKKRIA